VTHGPLRFRILATPLAALSDSCRDVVRSDGPPRFLARQLARRSSGFIWRHYASARTRSFDRSRIRATTVSENGLSGLKLCSVHSRSRPSRRPPLPLPLPSHLPFIPMFISIISFRVHQRAAEFVRTFVASLKFICLPSRDEPRDTLCIPPSSPLYLSLFLFNIHLLCIIFHSRAVKRA